MGHLPSCLIAAISFQQGGLGFFSLYISAFLQKFHCREVLLWKMLPLTGAAVLIFPQENTIPRTLYHSREFCASCSPKLASISPASSFLSILLGFLNPALCERESERDLFASYGTVKNVFLSCSWQRGCRNAGVRGENEEVQMANHESCVGIPALLLVCYPQWWTSSRQEGGMAQRDTEKHMPGGHSFMPKVPCLRNKELRCKTVWLWRNYTEIYKSSST